VTVDDERCRGHGVCTGLCPEVFTLTDDGYAVAAAHDAIDNCPEHAITAT
jgi:ferredoxin